MWEVLQPNVAPALYNNAKLNSRIVNHENNRNGLHQLYLIQTVNDMFMTL